MSKPINPYVAGNPIRNATGFFGREDILDWVAQEFRNPGTSALVLFGQRRIGKTTLLLQLKNFLPSEEFLPILFDLEDQARRPLGQILTDLAGEMADALNIEPPAEKIDDRGIKFRKEFLPTFLNALGKNRRPILLLDEFDVLDKSANELPEESAANSLFPFLRHLMTEFSELAFVFVAGRSPDDLALDFNSTFKASLVREIWVLDDESAKSIILQAEANRSLKFTEDAIDRISSLTHNHPFLTQLLCQRIWERSGISKTENNVPTIDSAAVDDALEDTLVTGDAALRWLWDGLSAAERIYAAALAESSEEGQPISEDVIIQVLSAYANRLRTREVELAPRDLVKRRILEEAEDNSYVFAIDILRRWVKKHRPLKAVKEDLENEDRAAASLFLAGESFFQRKKWNDARDAFEKTISVNPRHFKAHLFLGETLLEMGETNEALNALQKAFDLDNVEARLPLARAWVANANTLQSNGDENDALDACERALELSPRERGAQSIKSIIWNKRGDEAVSRKNWGEALNSYKNAGNESKVQEIQERQGQEEEFVRHFTEGLGALQQGEWGRARDALHWVVSRQPDYEHNNEKAVYLLAQAVESGKKPPLFFTVWLRKPQNRIFLVGLPLILFIAMGMTIGNSIFSLGIAGNGPFAWLATSTPTPTVPFTPTVTSTQYNVEGRWQMIIRDCDGGFVNTYRLEIIPNFFYIQLNESVVPGTWEISDNILTLKFNNGAIYKGEIKGNSILGSQSESLKCWDASR